MSVHSGRFGVVGGVSTVRNWRVNDAAEVPTEVTSNTAFGTNRKPGVEAWDGGYDLYGYAPPAGQMPGDTLAFVGYTAPDNDANSVGLQYSGSALIKQLVVNWNWAGAEVISMSADFDGHLALTSTPSTGPTLDASTPNFPAIGGTKFQFSPDGSTWTDWTDLVQAAWTLTNSVQPYVNSTTFIVDRFWTGRKQGIIDWKLAVTEQNTDRARFKKGDQLWLRLYVTSSLFWLLKFGRVIDFTNIVIDRETGKIIQQTVNVAMAGSKDSDGSLGTVTKPDGTVWWPVAQS